MTNWKIKIEPIWLQGIPKHWQLLKVKHLFILSKELNLGEDIDILSLTQRGIIKRDISRNEGQIASSYENYTRIRPGDFVFNPMDLITGFVDLSNFNGVISLAYTTLRPNSKYKIYNKFYKYYFQWHYLQKIFFPFGQGVSPDHRWNLKDDTLLNFPIVYPPYEEQIKIADYLESKLTTLNMAASKIKMHLLDEYKTSLIYEAVTGRLKK